MKKILVSTALCGLAAEMSTASSFTRYPHVPLVLWSPRPIFAGSNTYLSSEMDESAVASMLKLVVTRDVGVDEEGVLGTREFTFEKAEVMCLFLVPSLTTEDMAQLSKGKISFVHEAVQTSASSVVIPHTTRTKPLLPELASANPHFVGSDDLDVFIASAQGKVLFSNAKTDLLVVQLPVAMSLSDVDATIGIATSNLNAAYSGKLDFGFTGNDVQLVKLPDPPSRRLVAKKQAKVKNNETQPKVVCEADYLVGYTAAGKAFCFTHRVNITPDIMAGLLFGFLFVVLAYIGLSVLHQIQTPQRYPSQGAPRGKEF
ncbi:hypothetical protein PsorP6_016108 [Peronosclerospora sorghi]|uniref:Uncharacterized protein n=1 Tax=Peronosclerospora sorghi TaxID=230839 RepID=A0ACC0VS86_9STRA|nr:hypothetical protein PsorP6_016108 [Peronosclerospora sorghi]